MTETDGKLQDAHIRLVTRADDVGMARGINTAVRECISEGILRNASVMAPSPRFDDAVERLADCEELCIGLHVTLTSVMAPPHHYGPVLPPEEVPSLVNDDGYFMTRDAFDEAEVHVEEMLAETQAQLRTLREAGLDPDYLDDHVWVRKLHGFKEPLRELAADENLIDGHDETVVERLPPTGSYSGRNSNSPTELIDRLKDAPPGTYLAVAHPGDGDDESIQQMRRRDGNIKEERATEMDDERRMFVAPSVTEYCAEHGITPIRYTEI